ncbi:MAG: hypothetical protein AB1640_06195 [bacterium]
MNENKPLSYFRGFDLREALILALLGALIVAAKIVLRLPIKLTAHSTLFWMLFLVLGKGMVPRFGSGMMMGLLSGLLAVLMGVGKQGVFGFFKFFVPGLALDLVAPLLFLLLGKNALARPWAGAVLGMLVNLAKLATSIALARLLGLPLERMEALVGTVVVGHVVFGSLGGLLAGLALRRLGRLLPSRPAENGRLGGVEKHTPDS